MTWVRLSDGFPGHQKVRGLSDAAFRLHVTALCDAAAHLTDGVVTQPAVQTLPKAPQGAKLKRAIDELVAAGLWEASESGWRVHDFLDWNPSAASVRANREAARGRMTRLRSQDVRANTNGTPHEQPQNEPRTPPEHPPNERRTDDEHPPNESRSSGDRATRVPSRPDLNQRPPAKDLSGIQRAEPPERASVSCPKDLRLEAADLASLEMAPGIPPKAAEAIAAELVARWSVDPDKCYPTVVRWRQVLLTAIRTEWSDHAKRRRALDMVRPTDEVPSGRAEQDIPPEVAG